MKWVLWSAGSLAAYVLESWWLITVARSGVGVSSWELAIYDLLFMIAVGVLWHTKGPLKGSLS